MDIEFIVQDIFALTRPQWKLASNLEEAAKVFQLAMAQDQKSSGVDKTGEQDDASSAMSSDDENGDDLPVPEADGDDDSGSEEEEAEVCSDQFESAMMTNTNRPRIRQEIDQQSLDDTESEDEAIVVTRQEEDIDPEHEADFEREFAKMMAESLESRKFERKTMFDLPIPVRAKNREVATPTEPEDGNAAEGPDGAGTMAFSLLTKKGNRQQVSIESNRLLSTHFEC